MQHKTVLNYHSATLISGTVNREINSANSKIATSNTETLKQCNINREICAAIDSATLNNTRSNTEVLNIATLNSASLRSLTSHSETLI